MAAEDEGGRVLVDASAFFLRDAHDVAVTLAQKRQGRFRLDASRSAFYLPCTKTLPDNTEMEATLTCGRERGKWTFYSGIGSDSGFGHSA